MTKEPTTSTVRMNLNVDPDIPNKLAELAGSRSRMGYYLSTLIRQIHTGLPTEARTDPGDLAILQSALKHIAVKTQDLDQRVNALEQAAAIAKKSPWS
jgi:hypothetical protein